MKRYEIWKAELPVIPASHVPWPFSLGLRCEEGSAT